MILHRLNRLTLLLCSVLFSALAFGARGKKVLSVAYIHFPPYSVDDGAGNLSGPLIEKFNEIAKLAGYEYKVFSYPIPRIQEYIDQGVINATFGSRFLKYDEETAFVSQRPVFNLELQVFWRKSEKSIEKKEDLVGKKVGLIKGFYYGRVFAYLTGLKQTDTEVVYFRNNEAAFEQLELKKIDYLLDYKMSADQIISKHNVRNIERQSLGTVDLHFFLNVSFPDAENAMAEIEKSIQMIGKKQK